MRSAGYLFREGIKSLWKNRTMSIASVAVLISCLLITGIAILLSLNLDSTMKFIEGNNSVSVFLDSNLPQITAIQVGEQIRSIDNISECEYVSKDDGLKSIMEQMDADATLFEGLDGDDNWMPVAYKISMTDLSKYDETIEAIVAIEGVDHYTDYSDIAAKLNNLDTLIRYASIAIVAVLAIVSLFIISNTVKVTMFSRRVEINIMKSVGATNMFVRVPFIVEGLLIGLISGAVSGGVLYLAYGKLTEAVYGIVNFINVVDIEPYLFYLFGGYALAGTLFGVMGGVISIGRYLKREGENAVA